jgi:3-deoxy-D-manno-octulosonic-acid transferase
VSYFFYNVVLNAVVIASLPFLPVLWLLGERFRDGLFERMGCYSQTVKNRLAGARPVWIHAASVGEVMCAATVIQELRKRFPERTIIVSTFTNTGNRMARQATAADLVIFLPLDLSWTVRRALAVLDPALLVVLETEIWPNLLREVYKRGIPSLLLSGRISARAFRKYSWFRFFFRRVLQSLTAVGMQTAEDADRLAALGVRRERIIITGSLKRARAQAPEKQPERIADDNKGPSSPRNRLLVVGSSHRGEEDILLDVFASLRSRFPDLQMVLAPRHPQRFAEVEKLLRSRGFEYEKRSESNGRLYFRKEILFLDTLGDLLDFYAIGDVAFVGGSLVDAGGHNLLEPARFRKAVFFGPYMSNFDAVAAEMKRKGAAIQVNGSEELIEAISALLSDPEKRRIIGEKAFEIAMDDRDVVENSVALLCRYLSARNSRQRSPGGELS